MKNIDSAKYASKWWSVELPGSWSYTKTRDAVTFKLPTGTTIVITSMMKQSGAESIDTVRDFFKELLDSGWKETEITLGMLRGFCVQEGQPSGIERLYLSQNALLLAIVCSYVKSGQEIDRKDVHRVLAGIEILQCSP